MASNQQLPEGTDQIIDGAGVGDEDDAGTAPAFAPDEKIGEQTIFTPDDRDDDDGVTPEAAKSMVRRSNTTIAALMVKLGDADAMLCGLTGRFDAHLAHIQDIIGMREGERCLATLSALMMQQRALFIADTYNNRIVRLARNW